MVISFLSLLYWLNEDKQRILEEQLEKQTLKQVINRIKSEVFFELSKAQKKINQTRVSVSTLSE